MHERVIETSGGPVVVRLDYGLGRAPVQWRASLGEPVPWLTGPHAAIGASEDSALDNFWAAVESQLGGEKA